MKNSLILFNCIFVLLFFSCEKNNSSKLSIDYKSVKELYNQEIKITPMDGSVII